MPFSPTGDFYAPDFYEPDFLIMGNPHDFEYEMSGGIRVRGKAGIRTNVDVETPLVRRRPTLSTDGVRNPVFVLYQDAAAPQTKLKKIRGGIVPLVTTRELEMQEEKKPKPLVAGVE